MGWNRKYVKVHDNKSQGAKGEGNRIQLVGGSRFDCFCAKLSHLTCLSFQTGELGVTFRLSSFKDLY